MRVVLAGVDAALDAHLGRAPGHGIPGLAEHHLHGVVVGVGVVLVAREAAEAAPHVTHVGEVHVAVHDVGDVVALVGLAGHVRRAQQRGEVRALRAQQPRGLGGAELAAVEGGVEAAGHLGIHVGEQAFEHQAASCAGNGRARA